MLELNSKVSVFLIAVVCCFTFASAPLAPSLVPFASTSTSPVTCTLENNGNIVSCVAIKGDVRIDDVRVEDALSSACSTNYWTSEEKQSILNVFSRMSPQEKSAHSSNPQATIEHLMSSNKITSAERIILLKHMFGKMQSPWGRGDAFFYPLQRGEKVGIVLHSCPSLKKIDFVIDRQVFEFVRK